MKNIFLCLFLNAIVMIAATSVSGQSVYRFAPIQKNMLIDEVVEFSAPSPAISSTLPAAILAVNFHYNDRDEAGGLLLKLNERTECAFAIKMTSADASLLLKDQIQVGADLIILANYFSKTTQKTGVLLARINVENKSIVWSHLYGAGHPLDSYSAADLNYSRGFIYVLTNRSTLVGPTSRERMSVWKVSENGQFAFSLTIANDNAGVNDVGSSIVITPDNNILVSGLSTALNSSVSKIILCKLSLVGNLLISKDLVFKDINGRIQRPDFPFLDINAGNIHLACQAILGRSDQGVVLITMLDNDLNLRTWRDYSPKIRMEDFRIGGGKFLLSGQEPVTNGGNAYGFVGINNLNAIPEIVDYYRSGFESVSIATSSSIVYHNAWQQFLMASRPNKSAESFVNVVERKNDLNGKCSEQFAFTVTKDEVTVNEVTGMFNDSLLLGEESFNFELEEVSMSRENICLETGLQEKNKSEFSIYPNPANQFLTVELDPEIWSVSFLQITDMLGKVVLTNNFLTESKRIDLSGLKGGMYLISLKDDEHQKFAVKRFLKID